MTNAPIKVAVLAERLGTSAGGTEVYERCLLTALLDDEFRGGDIRIIPVLARAEAMDVLPPSIRSSCQLLKPGGKLGTMFSTGKLLKKIGADVFHSCFVTPLLLGKVPVVATVHDLGFLHFKEHYPRMLAWKLKKTFYWTLRRADMIVTVSEATKSDILDVTGGTRQRIQTIHNGLDSHFQCNGAIKPDLAFLERCGIRQPYILYTGRLEPRKNVPVLIEAYEKLRASGRFDGQLVLLGATRTFMCEATQARIDRSPQRDDIIQPGHVPDEMVPSFYAGASALVLISLYEGFGLPVLEAMAYGLPVVCSNTTSLPEIAGDAGLLVDPHDPSCVADALARVVNDQVLRREMIAKGHDRVAQFTWRRAAEQFLDLYRELAHRHAHSRDRQPEMIAP